MIPEGLMIVVYGIPTRKLLKINKCIEEELRKIKEQKI